MKIKSVLSKDNLYGNLEVYSPKMDLMFFCNQRKLNFYIRKNLVKKIGEKKYQLTFEPNGLGYSADDGFLGLNKAARRHNRCVITGKEDNLTRHHIVPSLFRKHLPEKYKCSFVLVVLVNAYEHRRYTIEEQKFYDVLAEKYGVEKLRYSPDKEDRKQRNIAHALLMYINAIPEDVQKKLRVEFEEITGLKASEENLKEYIDPPYKKHKKRDNAFGVELVSKVTDFDEFERIWLNHFIETTNPKFLPEDLILKYNIKTFHDENQTNL